MSSNSGERLPAGSQPGWVTLLLGDCAAGSVCCCKHARCCSFPVTIYSCDLLAPVQGESAVWLPAYPDLSQGCLTSPSWVGVSGLRCNKDQNKTQTRGKDEPLSLSVVSRWPPARALGGCPSTPEGCSRPLPTFLGGCGPPGFPGRASQRPVPLPSLSTVTPHV